jgi:hypothetical protein
MKITKNQLREISENLQGGLKCLLNNETGELEFVLVSDHMYGDTEVWDEILKRVDLEWKNPIIIENMESWQVFGIMEDFIEEIDDHKLKQIVFKILHRKSPFANYKYVIESSVYRQKWFNFKNKKYEEYVIENLVEKEIEYEQYNGQHIT